MPNGETKKPDEIMEIAREFEPGKIENYEFVRPGEKIDPIAGAFVTDVGNNLVEGVADHHHLGDGQKCATALVVENPDLVLSWHNYKKINTLKTHADPDFDAAASVFMAKCLVENGELPQNAHEIAEYANGIDFATLEFSDNPEKSPYGIYYGILKNTESYWDGKANKWVDKSNERMKKLQELMQWISERGLSEEAFADKHPFKEEETMIKEDFENYQNDLGKSEKKLITVINQDGEKQQVDLAIIDRPDSTLAKDWFRNDKKGSSQGRGFEYLMVQEEHSSGGERFIISVMPDRNIDLEGLGAAIDQAETEARGGKDNDKRYEGDPRPGFNNSDPWYDGRGHQYTIIDTPRSGTKLTAEQIKDLVTNPEKWQEKK